jgi:hypothetical protein
MHITFTWNQVFFIFAFFIALVSLMIGVAVAQEVYRPVLTKQDGNPSFGLCIGSEQIAAAAKVFGIPWVADVNAMTLLGDGQKVEIEFANGCAVSAKVVR